MTKKEQAVKFIQIQPGIAPNAQVPYSDKDFRTGAVVYALDTDGSVWWWGGRSWVQCGPQPEKESKNFDPPDPPDSET